ncbi:ferric reduction oxidase 8, mitochondrial [Iris pallida]|uniref:Ferric reduction oxidase 8, mitochondrial n=1 Tax=Iris pallida TaxID=29817 RepID=A0AAX6FE72_IRIPA|nr:ferric reduction oxidase 8, mitochondrial [Iris pallida]
MSRAVRAGLKLSIAAILAVWVVIWILKPTKLWKKSWHVAEDWAESTGVLRESGLNVIVFCFPILAMAVLLYILAYLRPREGRIRQSTSLIARFSDPIIINSPIGTLSSCELLAAALFLVFLAWTYYSNLASDLKRTTPSKILKLNRRQLKVMAAGVRFGSLSEACLALLLLPVLRGMSLFNKYMFGVQFEASVRYHVWIGNGIMLFTLLHSATIMSVWGEKSSLWVEITRWQSTGRVYLAGAIALLTLCVIWLSSLPPVRRTKFHLFYLTHHLYLVFLFFFLMHAGAGHFYSVFAGVLLFALDKILRIAQSSRSTSVLSVRVLACKAIELTLPKHPSMQYAPTSTIFVKIPSISRLQWHPFSITSSSNMDDDRLSVMIKCQGPWTSSLYEKIQSIQVPGSESTKSLIAAMEGPYGPATFDYQRYGSLLLVAGGSGITPFLSILQDVASRNRDTNTCPTRIELVYAVKKSVDLSMLTPISWLLLDWPPGLGHLKLRVFVTQEKDRSGNSVSEILHEMSQVKAVILDQHSSGEHVPKPQGLLLKAAVAGLASVAFLVSLVCLTHVFIHKEKRSSPNKTPSWISDTLVLCSFVIATSCAATMAVALSMGRKDVHVPAVPRNKSKSAETCSENVQNVWGEDEINFGKRPNLIDIVSELQNELGRSEVGVFVCGPDSLQRSVASVCRATCSQKYGRKNKLLLRFHSINFSL